MTLASALAKMWQDGAAALASTGYALFNIEANLMCIIVLMILFIRQQNSSSQTDAQIVWDRMLFVQILYCLSGILRVLVDVNIIPQKTVFDYVIWIMNVGLFGCICWLTFVYIELYQKTGLLDSLRNKIYSALPFVINFVNLALYPLISEIAGIPENLAMIPDLIIALNLLYPATGIILAFVRRRKMGKYERDSMSVVGVYPAFFMIFGALQALNWRIPFLCYAVMVSDIFVYINYADSLVSVDPLTKIANRNGLIRALSERLGQENAEGLYVFAIDVNDLSSINSSYSRQEGDKALIVVANALKKLKEEEHPCYISRYYGDEFIVTADIGDKEELELFVEHIRNYISNAVIANGLPYHLRVSIGYSHYEQFSRTETISGLIDEADRMLNENREQRKFASMWNGTRSIG